MTAPGQVMGVDGPVTITKRQMDVARCAAEGFDVAGTAAVLGLGIDSIKHHRVNLLAKLGTLTMTAACVRLVRAGLL